MIRIYASIILHKFHREIKTYSRSAVDLQIWNLERSKNLEYK